MTPLMKWLLILAIISVNAKHMVFKDGPGVIIHVHVYHPYFQGFGPPASIGLAIGHSQWRSQGRA